MAGFRGGMGRGIGRGNFSGRSCYTGPDLWVERGGARKCRFAPFTYQHVFYGCPVGMRSTKPDPPGAHATRRRSPCSGSHLPHGPPFVSFHGPGNTFLCQDLSYLTACPFRRRRSATRRVVSVGMPVHPGKRTKYGRRVPQIRRPNVSAGCRTHQREVGRDRVTERYARVRSTATNTMRRMA